MKIKGLEGKKIKIKKRWIALGIVLLIIAGVTVNAVSKGNQVPQIPAAQVVRGDVETIVSASGVVESEESRVYYAPLNAKVEKVNVEKGDSVKKGDVLLTYDTEDLEFTQREGSLEAAASENSYLSAIAESNKQQQIYDDSTEALVNVESMIVAQRDFINNLKNYVTDEKAKRRLELLNEKYKLNRQQNGIAVNMEIKPDGKITDSMWSADYEVRNKIAEIDKKIEALDLNEELTDIEQQIVREQEKLEDLLEYKADRKADQSSAENAILNEYKKKELEAAAQKTKINEERAQAHLDEAMEGITAEFNGVITELNVHDGFVTDQSSKLMTVESSEDVRVNISLSKYDLEKVTEGQKAEVTVAGKKYDGVVSKINHVAEKNDAGTRLVTAQIHIDNPDKSIYLGIEGRVLIHAQTSRNTLVVPFAAINTDQKGDFCYVISDGVVERRSVTVGLTSEDQMEILEGLSEGDVVITDSSMGVEEGMAVEPLIEGAAEDESESAQ